MKNLLTKSVAGALLLATTATTGIHAQQDGAAWDRERPDVYTPAGVALERIQPVGAVEFYHRYAYTKWAGNRAETSGVLPDDLLLSIFSVVPADSRRNVAEVGALIGVTEWLTLTGEVGYVLVQTDQFTETDRFGTETDGIGDVAVGALFRFLETERYRSHFGLAVSVPIGPIDATSTTPLSFGEEVVLPYPQQIGSGTVDVRPSATFESQNQHGTFGAKVWGVTRVGENDRQYTLGDRFGGTAWFAPRFNDHFSGSIRFRWETWGDIQGFDPALDPLADQQAYPLTQGGSRLDVPVGLNFYPANGGMAGVRVGMEFVFPVRHDLNGPQLGMDWGFRFRLSREF